MKINDIVHFTKADVQYSQELHEIHNGWPFLSVRMKIKKIEKLVANLYDKKYFIHIRNLKQALNQGLLLNKIHRIIKFDQKS